MPKITPRYLGNENNHVVYICCRLWRSNSFWIGFKKTTNLCGDSFDDSDLNCHRRGWTWADGTTYNYPQFHDWQQDEPHPNKLCGVLAHLWYYDSRPSNSATGWFSGNCSHKYKYICEKGNCFNYFIEHHNNVF